MSAKIKQISPFHQLQYKRGKPLITDIRTGELIFYVGEEPIVFVKELLTKYLTEERKNLSIDDPIFHKLEGKEDGGKRWNTHQYISFNNDGHSWYCEIIHRTSTYLDTVEIECMVGLGKTLTECVINSAANIILSKYGVCDYDKKLPGYFKDIPENYLNIKE